MANGENASLLVTKLQATATLIPDSRQVPVSSVDLGWIFPAVRKRGVSLCNSSLWRLNQYGFPRWPRSFRLSNSLLDQHLDASSYVGVSFFSIYVYFIFKFYLLLLMISPHVRIYTP